MDVTAKYELIGLMAHPARHSLSPMMQNAALEKLGVPMVYMVFEVTNETFADAIKGLKALGMRGTGISMPNKQVACQYVDELDPAAKLVGAINTIVNDDGYLKGYNTDGTGHLWALKEAGFDVAGKKMVLAGAGGAAMAIAAQAAIEGMKEVAIFNSRDAFFERAFDFASRVNEATDCQVGVYDLRDDGNFAYYLAQADFFSNATSAGMKPDTSNIIRDKSMLHPELVVSDCVYNPRITPLLAMAEEVGCKTIDGYGMLLWQGAEQFKLWTGKDFPLEHVKQVMGFDF